jgi:hypothetical protein
LLGPTLWHVDYLFPLFSPQQNNFVTSYLCRTVPPPLAALGATALVGDLLPAPTDVELGAAGWKFKTIIIFKMVLGMCRK